MDRENSIFHNAESSSRYNEKSWLSWQIERYVGTTKEKMSHKSLFCRKDNARASRKWSAPLVGGILADLAVVKDHFFDKLRN